MSENPNITTTTEENGTAMSKEAKIREFFMRARKCFWVAIAILIMLLILSIIVLGVRMNDYFQSANREVSLNSLIHKNELDIFDVYYENENGVITVHGFDDDKVVAPGTDVEYTVRIRNTDNIAIDYELLPEMSFYSEYELPILVRILDPNDDYILGSEKEWADITKLNGIVHRNTIMKGESVEYTFQWKWPFEQGNDEYDTFLGNTNEKVGLTVKFTVNSAANFLIEDNGGLVPSGWAANIAIMILAILLLIAIILLIISIINKKLNHKEPEPQPEPEPVIIPAIVPEPEPQPEPEPIPTPMPAPAPAPKKKEGFCGKMAYVNIDVLQDNFNAGDVITLKVLKEKGIIDADAKQMKVLARNGYELNKAFIIETQGVSSEARKIITKAGGVIIITKG